MKSKKKKINKSWKIMIGENRKREILIVFAILIIQSIIFVIAGTQKAYIHMDEAYSLGLASYDKTEIQANDDFYDNWHNKEYYEDYLTVNEDEVGEYSQVYENQKNDVHPPLYYLILRFAMGFNVGKYSKWPGIIVNIIIYLFITLVMYLILQKLLKGKEKVKEKSIILAFISSITMASLTTVLYIRMYALATLNVLIITYLHIKLLESKDINLKLLFFIGLSVLAGILTHYYYLFFLAMLYLIFAIKYIKQKQYKNLALYTLTMIISGGLSLVIWPYSIKHMFFGYRGQGVISNLLNIKLFITNIILYLQKMNRFAFNNLLLFIFIMVVGFVIYKKIKKIKEKSPKNEIAKIMLYPSIFYFLVVAVASPWIEIRYIMPICGIVFILVIYYVDTLLHTIYEEKISNKIIALVLIATLISPLIFRIEPEVMFSDKKEIVSKMENELNVPTVFFFNSSHNRFLDDILLFATVDESYVAKDIEYTEENIKKILENKDISKGIIVFINGGQENDDILAVVKRAMNFENIEYLKRLNACDVYFLK